jgi:hypothetical protein
MVHFCKDCSTWNVLSTVAEGFRPLTPIQVRLLLAVKTKQDDDTEDDRSQENLSDVVVENLLVGVGGVAELGLRLSRRFTGDNGTECGGYVLFYVHDLDSLGCNAKISLQFRNVFYSWGVPLFPRARVFITKVPPHYNYFFSKLLQIYFPKRDFVARWAAVEGLTAGDRSGSNGQEKDGCL